jgi:hypothetical protein
MLHEVGMKRLLVSRIHEPSEESSFSTEKTNFRFLLSVMAIFDQSKVEMAIFDQSEVEMVIFDQSVEEKVVFGQLKVEMVIFDQ